MTIAYFFIFLHSYYPFSDMNRTCFIIPFLFCALLLTGCGDKEVAPPPAEEQPIDTLQTILLKAQQCSRLYTTEFHIHKIVTYDDLISVSGKLFNQDYNLRLPVGHRKVAFPMDATLKGYIDMEQLTPENFTRDGERLTITLPNPQVMMTATKIDQASVREYVSLTRAHFSDHELSELEHQGREAIIRQIPDYGIAEQARINAARLLIPLATQLGFREENVTIVFSDDFKPESLTKLVKLNTSGQ